MRGRDLGIAFGVIGAFALWPSFIWLFAQFGWLSDRWFETGGAVQYTFPIALALSAVLLAVHGMMRNGEIAADLEARFEADPELLEDGAPVEQRVPVAAAAVASGGAPAGGAAPTVELPVDGDEDGSAEVEKPKLGGKMAVAPRPKGFKDENKKGKQPKVRKVGKQVGRRAGYKAKNAVSRGIRERLGLRF